MDIVFGTKWFERHQRKLLWLLNTPIIKIWFRWVMCIHEKGVINRITPNSISYNVKIIGDKLEVMTDFRTHDKYSKRLYYAFKPFWYLLHFFDWAMLDRVEALTKLNFGFATLTVYPNPGVTTDGWTRRNVFGSPQTFANLIAGAGTESDDTSTVEQGLELDSRSMSSGNYYRIKRDIYLFDTSALTSGATISDGVLSVYTSAKTNGYSTNPDFEIVSSNPASNTGLVAADHGTLGSTVYASIGYTSISGAGAYNDFTLDATGRGTISKTGISKFGARNSWDRSASGPTWAATSMSFDIQYSDYAGTARDPKLVVTYTVVVGPANLKSYNTNVAANIKSIDTNLIANVKSLNTNT